MEKKQSHTIEFISLLTQHQMMLRGFIISLLPGSDDVNDVVQETNIVLWKKKKSFKQGTSFKAWAFAVARNKVKQHLTQLYKDGKRDQLAYAYEEEFINAVAEAQNLLVTDDRELLALEHCMKTLSDQERDLVRARYNSSIGLDQYAAKLGKSGAYLRVSLSRIRAKLKSCIEKRMLWEGISK
ncbi:MAG: sigma-70 family RNA polymerase sigma factor [Akkermansiaceae bacterium]